MNNIKSTPMILGFLMAILSLISCKKKDAVAARVISFSKCNYFSSRRGGIRYNNII